ncbi:uncharacterized protein LOC110359654 isoform X3 [Columba livia]|uniref:uncharacterized protein LOC110359654 isoform X3 n=1 Tax=Columba livia TaxID=8932 RepID=UPI0031BA931B
MPGPQRLLPPRIRPFQAGRSLGAARGEVLLGNWRQRRGTWALAQEERALEGIKHTRVRPGTRLVLPGEGLAGIMLFPLMRPNRSFSCWESAGSSRSAPPAWGGAEQTQEPLSFPRRKQTPPTARITVAFGIFTDCSQCRNAPLAFGESPSGHRTALTRSVPSTFWLKAHGCR